MTTPLPGPGERVVGVSLPVAEPYAGQLLDARRSFGDPHADEMSPHITLVPPVVLPDGRVDEVVGFLTSRALDFEPFQVRLRGTGTFRPVSPVVFVQVVVGIAGCERLEARTRSGPLAGQTRFHYHPHVTIAHDLPDDILDLAFEHYAGYDAAFTADVFSLHEFDGATWSKIQDFPLG